MHSMVKRQLIEGDDYSIKPMVTKISDGYPMVAEESSVANPQKVAKIDEKNQKNRVGNTA